MSALEVVLAVVAVALVVAAVVLSWLRSPLYRVVYPRMGRALRDLKAERADRPAEHHDPTRGAR